MIQFYKQGRRFFILFYCIFFVFTANAQSWIPVGNPGFSAGSAVWPSITIDGNGIPYVAYSDASVGYAATVMKYYGGGWVNVGMLGFSGGPVAQFSNIAMALDTAGVPYVVYGDGDPTYGHAAIVMKYSDTGWATVGAPDFSSVFVSSITIAIDRKDTPYVAYTDSIQKASVMKYNGSSWVTVGIAGFSAGTVDWTSMAIDSSGTPYVVYYDNAAGGKATVMKYNGSSWVLVGSAGFSTGTAWYTAIAIDRSGTPYVVYADADNDQKATVMKYNGSGWITVGSAGFSIGAVQYISIAIDSSGTPYVSYDDYGSGQKATVMEYNGINWITAGNVGFSAGEAFFTSVAINGSGAPYVVYEDSVNEAKATVMKLDTSIHTGVGNIANKIATSLSIAPNPNNGSFILNISFPTKEEATIIITDVLGGKVKELTATTNTDIQMQLNCPPGVYFISADTKSGRLTAKMVVE